MAYYSGHVDEDAINATQADYDPRYRMHRATGAPPPMERESETAYRRRLAEGLQQHAPNCRDFNIRHSTGSAFDVLERQIKEDAQREAIRPSVPEGELREVTRYDQSGRPYQEFFGSPKVWMSAFEPDDKRYVKGILDTRTGWHKV